MALTDPATPLPPDRTIAYPWIGVSLLQDWLRARARHGQDGTHRRTLNLGLELTARLGWAVPAFGADRTAAVLEASVARRVQPGPGPDHHVRRQREGRATGDAVEDGSSTHRRSLLPPRQRTFSLFFMSLSGSAAANLDPDHQLLLGGDDGAARLSPALRVSATRGILLTLEERFCISSASSFTSLRIGRRGLRGRRQGVERGTESRRAPRSSQRSRVRAAIRTSTCSAHAAVGARGSSPSLRHAGRRFSSRRSS